jgi:hypothetical protein
VLTAGIIAHRRRYRQAKALIGEAKFRADRAPAIGLFLGNLVRGA